MVIFGPCPLVGAPVWPNMLNTPKSASGRSLLPSKNPSVLLGLEALLMDTTLTTADDDRPVCAVSSGRA